MVAAVVETAIAEPASIGDILVQSRQSQGLTLAEVSARIRVRAAMLEALENNDYAAMPAPIYAIGFLRSYSSFLGLDADDLVGRYRRDSVVSEGAKDYHLPPIERSKARPGQGLIWFCLFLLVGLAAAGIWQYRAQGQLAALVPMLPERLRDLAQQPSPVKLSPTNQPVGRVFGETGPTRLVIVAQGQSWVEVRDHQGSLLLTRVLQAADQYRVPMRSGLRLSTGDAGVLSIKIDDVDLGLLGDPGAALRDFELSIEGLQTHINLRSPAVIPIKEQPNG
jgi:transcriptional regulator with XRE-family HTH domain